MALGFGQLRALARQAGFSDNESAIAASIALAESGGVQNATNHNTNGSTDYGLWQINSVHSQYDASRLMSDPVYNARAAFEIYKAANNHFTPWSAYNSNANRKFLPQGGLLGSAVRGWFGAGDATASAIKNNPVTDAAGSAAKSVGDAAAALPNSVTALNNTVGQIGGKLFNLDFWKRAGIVLIGAVLVMLGFIFVIGSNSTAQGIAKKVAP